MFSDDIKTSGSPKTGYFLILSLTHSLLDRVRFFYNFNWFYPSLPADVLWGSFVTHSFLPHVGEK